MLFTIAMICQRCNYRYLLNNDCLPLVQSWYRCLLYPSDTGTPGGQSRAETCPGVGGEDLCQSCLRLNQSQFLQQSQGGRRRGSAARRNSVPMQQQHGCRGAQGSGGASRAEQGWKEAAGTQRDPDPPPGCPCSGDTCLVHFTAAPQSEHHVHSPRHMR